MCAFLKEKHHFFVAEKSGQYILNVLIYFIYLNYETKTQFKELRVGIRVENI